MTWTPVSRLKFYITGKSYPVTMRQQTISPWSWHDYCLTGYITAVLFACLQKWPFFNSLWYLIQLETEIHWKIWLLGEWCCQHSSHRVHSRTRSAHSSQLHHPKTQECDGRNTKLGWCEWCQSWLLLFTQQNSNLCLLHFEDMSWRWCFMSHKEMWT